MPSCESGGPALQDSLQSSIVPSIRVFSNENYEYIHADRGQWLMYDVKHNVCSCWKCSEMKNSLNVDNDL